MAKSKRTENAPKSDSLLAPLFELMASEYRELGVIVTYQVGIGLMTLAIPVGVQAIVNNLAFTQLFQPVLFLAFAILFCQILAGVLRVSQMRVVERVQRRIFAHLGMELAYRLPRMNQRDGARFPEVVNRFFDVITVQKSFAMLAIEGFGLVLQMVIGLVLLAFYHPFLLIFDIGLIFSLLVIVFLLGRGALEKSIEESRWKYRTVEWLEEIAAKSVAFSSKSARFFALQRADQIVDSYLDARQKTFSVILRQMIGFLSLQAVANVTLLSLGVWLVIENQLSIGQLVAAELVVSGVLYSFTRFQKHLTAFYDLIAALDKITYLFDFPLEHEGRGLPLRSTGEILIEARDLVYYPMIGGSPVGPFSLTLKQGAKYAVHGSNGVGKSSLLDMLYGLKEPSSGTLVFNGADARMLSIQLLREHIALIRGIEVVHGSIIKNVRLGYPQASMDQITDALKRVGLLDTVLDFPEGLSTVLTEGGIPLSVGQVKLLLLARAIIGEPRVLLIDQTLDGLDTQSKNTALDLIFSPDAPWSVVITSQDPEVRSRCDAVIELDQVSTMKEAS